MLLEPQLWFRR